MGDSLFTLPKLEFNETPISTGGVHLNPNLQKIKDPLISFELMDEIGSKPWETYGLSEEEYSNLNAVQIKALQDGNFENYEEVGDQDNNQDGNGEETTYDWEKNIDPETLGGGGSVVDFLNESGGDSSYKNRFELSKKFGMENYSGTAEQNDKLLSFLQNGGDMSMGPNVNQQGLGEDGSGSGGGSGISSGDAITNPAISTINSPSFGMNFNNSMLGIGMNNQFPNFMNNNSHGFQGFNQNQFNPSQLGFNPSFNSSSYQFGDATDNINKNVDETLETSKKEVPMSKWNLKDKEGNAKGKQFTKAEAQQVGEGFKQAGSQIAGMYGDSNFSFS